MRLALLLPKSGMGVAIAQSEAFAACVAGFEVVPELDVFLVFFPAEKDFPAVAQGGEIDQAAAQVLDLDFPALEMLESLLDFADGAQQLVDRFTAGVIAARRQGANAFVEGVEAFLGGFQIGQPLADFWQEGARLLESVMFGEMHGPHQLPPE